MRFHPRALSASSSVIFAFAESRFADPCADASHPLPLHHYTVQMHAVGTLLYSFSLSDCYFQAKPLIILPAASSVLLAEALTIFLRLLVDALPALPAPCFSCSPFRPGPWAGLSYEPSLRFRPWPCADFLTLP